MIRGIVSGNWLRVAGSPAKALAKAGC